MSWTLLIAAIVGLAIIAAAVAIPLTRDAGGLDKEDAGDFHATLEAQVAELTGEEMAGVRADAAEDMADRSHDEMARILIENAMDAMGGIIARLDYSGERPTSEYNSLIRDALRSARSQVVRWEWGTRGVCERPHGSSQAEENAVSWTYIPPSTYELGTWSGSGTAIGVRVDGEAGTILFYRDGVQGH